MEGGDFGKEKEEESKEEKEEIKSEQ